MTQTCRKSLGGRGGDMTQQEICDITTAAVARKDPFSDFWSLSAAIREGFALGCSSVGQEMAFHATSTISFLLWMLNGHNTQYKLTDTSQRELSLG